MDKRREGNYDLLRIICAVPCFVMLSGAFILADEHNADYRFFTKKASAIWGFLLWYSVVHIFCITRRWRQFMW